MNTSGRKIKRNRALIGCGKQQELGSVPAVLLIRLLRGSAFWYKRCYVSERVR